MRLSIVFSLYIVLFWGQLAHAAFEYRLKTKLSKQQTEQVKAFFPPVEAALPQVIKDVLRQGVAIYFEEQEEIARVESPKGWNKWWGNPPPRKIILSRKLLKQEILQAPADPKDFLKKFLAENLLHETLHLFDYRAPKERDYYQARAYCASLEGSGIHTKNPDDNQSRTRYCSNIQRQQTTYSESSRYMQLSGWLAKRTPQDPRLQPSLRAKTASLSRY